MPSREGMGMPKTTLPTKRAPCLHTRMAILRRRLPKEALLPEYSKARPHRNKE